MDLRPVNFDATRWSQAPWGSPKRSSPSVPAGTRTLDARVEDPSQTVTGMRLSSDGNEVDERRDAYSFCHAHQRFLGSSMEAFTAAPPLRGTVLLSGSDHRQVVTQAASADRT